MTPLEIPPYLKGIVYLLLRLLFIIVVVLMEAEQLPGYTHKKRTMSDTLCDCGISLCCMFTLIGLFFLLAWDSLIEPIPSDQFSQTMFPYITTTSIVVIIWLFYQFYTRLARKKNGN